MQLRSVNKIPLFLILLILTAAVCPAEDLPGDSYLFIKSEPINAEIIIDGEPSLQRTPALIRNISGSHRLGILKDGFNPVYSMVTVEPGEPAVIEAGLNSGTLILNMPDEDKIVLKTSEQKLLPESFRLAEGEYSLKRSENGLELTPEYPKRDLLTVNTTLFITALAADIVFTAMELNETGELFFPHSTGLVLSEAVAGVLGLTELALLIDRKNWIDDFRVYRADLDTLDSEAERIYQSAQNALSRGNIEEALAGFSNLIGGFPDYRRFPEALYKVAKLHIISGDTNLAASELNIIIDLFPDPELYDRACQTLALLYFNAGETEKSREIVSRMVFHDPLFSGAAEELRTSGPDALVRNWARNPERQAD